MFKEFVCYGWETNIVVIEALFVTTELNGVVGFIETVVAHTF